MRFGLRAYLKDRAASVAVGAGAAAFCVAALVVYGTDARVAAFVAAVLALGGAGALLLDWALRRGFYARLDEAQGALGERSYLATELVERPWTLDERLFFDALDDESRAMRNAVADARRAQAEHRDYVESWVHEVKTPIVAARLALQNNPGALSERLEGDLDEVEGYVEQALFYARSAAVEADYQIREVVLGRVVREALRARARTLIDAQVTPELGEGLDLAVRADSKWLVFVLGQLLVNAAKYRRADGAPGHVRLWAERVQAGLDAWTTRLFVSDDGLGIPAADQARVWDKGFTGQNGRRFARSTGMGLYLVRELCTKMGVGVSLTSAEGVGTTFVLAFPA